MATHRPRRRRSFIAGSPLLGRSSDAALPDVTTLLSVLVFVLLWIPSRLIFGPLGGAGTPAQLLCILLAAWWIVMLIGGRRPLPPVSQPVRIAMLCLATAILASYVAASIRPIDGAELRSADLGMLVLLGWLGASFSAMDGIASRSNLDVLLKRVVLAGGAIASLALLQFITKEPWVNYIQIPGLTASNTVYGVYGRNGFARPAATSLHPIELGAVLTMILPIALHYALCDRTRGALRKWYPVLAIGAAIPIAISRSAIVSAAIVLLMLVPTWPRATRRRAYAVMLVMAATLYVTVPGLLGTITGLFTGISTEGSAKSRTDSYGIAFEFISKSPLVGRGFGTFLPSYHILDNQYLGFLIDTGILGLAALVGVFVVGVRTARRTRAATPSADDRDLAQCLAASVCAAAVSFALFDAFAFPMAATLIFLLLGCIGAHRRLTSGPIDATSALPAGAVAGERLGGALLWGPHSARKQPSVQA